MQNILTGLYEDDLISQYTYNKLNNTMNTYMYNILSSCNTPEEVAKVIMNLDGLLHS